MLIGDARQDVVQTLEVERGEIALAVEGVEMAVGGSTLPHTLMGDAHTAVGGWGIDGNEIEAVGHRAERFVGKHSADAFLAVAAEYVHLILAIAFGHECHVYLLAAVTRAAQVFPLLPLLHGTDEDILGIHAMLQAAAHLPVGVEEGDCDINRLLGHGHQEDVLEGFAHPGGLLGRLPLLEEGAERMAVEHHSRGIAHGYLSVALQQEAVHVDTAAKPTFALAHLVEIDLLLMVVAAEGVVEPECTVEEVLVKTLGTAHACNSQKDCGQHESRCSCSHV